MGESAAVSRRFLPPAVGALSGGTVVRRAFGGLLGRVVRALSAPAVAAHAGRMSIAVGGMHAPDCSECASQTAMTASGSWSDEHALTELDDCLTAGSCRHIALSTA